MKVVDTVAPASPQQILQLEGVSKVFAKGSKLLGTYRAVQAVRDVSLVVNGGEVLGLVGESGCGKSTLGRVILRLHDPSEGKIVFAGQDITTLSQMKLRPLRRELQIIFQDPYASLNPRMTVREIIAKPLQVHGIPYTNDGIREIMETVGLNGEFADRYPHQFSGGQRQRIGIGRAIAMNPRFIVCDEPVSALDVSVQAQILNLLTSLKEKLGLTYLFISHDLSVVKHISDRIAVMYLGNLVEVQSKGSFYERPLHPYSQALLSAIPVANPFTQRKRRRINLEGDLPSPLTPPPGCAFHTRCPFVKAQCREVQPRLQEVKAGEFVACHYPLG